MATTGHTEAQIDWAKSKGFDYDGSFWAYFDSMSADDRAARGDRLTRDRWVAHKGGAGFSKLGFIAVGKHPDGTWTHTVSYDGCRGRSYIHKTGKEAWKAALNVLETLLKDGMHLVR